MVYQTCSNFSGKNFQMNSWMSAWISPFVIFTSCSTQMSEVRGREMCLWHQILWFVTSEQGCISEAFAMFLLFLLLLQARHQTLGSPWCPSPWWPPGVPLISTLGADYSSDLSYPAVHESSLNRIHPLISRPEVDFTRSQTGPGGWKKKMGFSSW